jgi:hypothetical protein
VRSFINSIPYPPLRNGPRASRPRMVKTLNSIGTSGDIP